MISITSLFIGSLLLVILSLLLGVRNLLRRVEAYEDYFAQLQKGLVAVQSQLKEIDVNGAFAADDEVGAMFAGIKGMILSLNTFLMKDG